MRPLSGFDMLQMRASNPGMAGPPRSTQRRTVSRRRLSRERRAQILDAAARVITERGLADTRVSDIASRAGTSPGLVLYYFGSKDRLLAEALTFAEERFYARVAAELAEIPSARERLVKVIELSCSSDGSGGDAAWADDFRSETLLWLELWTRSPRDPDMARKRESLDRRWRQVLAEIVEDGQTKAEFRDVDPDDFATRFSALMDGLAVQVVLEDPAVTIERMRDLCLSAAATELGFDAEPGRARVR
jgi:AcrR family transcriptional regulator